MPAIPRDRFLDAMSRVAATVNVVTTDGPGGRAGVTVSAMTPVSADGAAPTLLICLHEDSRTTPAIAANRCFCIIHARCRRRISRQGQDDQQISRLRLHRARLLRPCPRPAAQGRLGRSRCTGFDMTWEVASDSKKHVKAIADALKDDPDLILATDPDREGEAISWHLKEALEKRRAIKKDTPVSRVTFNAITKDRRDPGDGGAARCRHGTGGGLSRPPRAGLSRGLHLSPVLWRKLPGAKSAGRVQSVALRLIVDREMEIEAFRPRILVGARRLDTPRGQSFEARLVSLGGKKLDRSTTSPPRPRPGWPSRPSPPARCPSRGWRPSPPRATPRRPS
jgi:hypothetical protein